MKAKLIGIIMISLLAAACGREQTNSDGNGPGNADGVGGRADPPTAPATQGTPATGRDGASGETDGEAPAGSDVDSATAPPPQ